MRRIPPTPLDLTNHRYIRGGFFNDAVITNRIVRITLKSGTARREYDKTSGFVANAYHLIEFDTNEPTTKVGILDPQAIDTIEYQVLDSVSNVGTVYWDRLGRRDPINRVAKLYFITGVSITREFNPSYDLVAGEALYVIITNDLGNLAEFSAFLNALEITI